MKKVQLRRSVILPLACMALALSACDGDSRPFEEAVEAVTLGLASLDVVPPANTQADLIINSNQAIQLEVSGRDDTGSAVILSASDRRWVSSDSSVASVSDNGVVVGGINGTALVSVSIGGIQSASLPITVNDQPLTLLSSIEGPDTLELCQPQDYFVVGQFADQSLRTLSQGVAYTVSEGGMATATGVENAVGRLNVMSPGALQLTVTSGDALSLTRQLTALSNLQSIAVTPPTPAVDVDDTTAFTATGTYNTDNGSAPQVDITASVDWQITTGDAFATLGNTSTNGGQLAGVSEGDVAFLAGCGNVLSDLRSVIVNEPNGSDSDDLSFNVGSDDFLSVGTVGTFALLVQQGSEFDDDEDSLDADELIFNVTSDDGVTSAGNIISLNQLDNGIVDGNGAGSVTVTVLLRDDTSVSGTFRITVTGS